MPNGSTAEAAGAASSGWRMAGSDAAGAGAAAEAGAGGASATCTGRMRYCHMYKPPRPSTVNSRAAMAAIQVRLIKVPFGVGADQANGLHHNAFPTPWR